MAGLCLLGNAANDCFVTRFRKYNKPAGAPMGHRLLCARDDGSNAGVGAFEVSKSQVAIRFLVEDPLEAVEEYLAAGMLSNLYRETESVFVSVIHALHGDLVFLGVVNHDVAGLKHLEVRVDANGAENVHGVSPCAHGYRRDEHAKSQQNP